MESSPSTSRYSSQFGFQPVNRQLPRWLTSLSDANSDLPDTVVMPAAINESARQTRTDVRTLRVGLIVCTFYSTYYSRMLDSAVNTLNELGIDAVVRSSNETCEGELQAFESLIDCGCDAFIIYSNELDDDTLRDMLIAHPTSVLMNRLVEGVESRCIYNDNVVGGQLAAEYLLAKGHHRIAMVTGQRYRREVWARSRGFVNALARQSVSMPEHLIIESNFTEEGGAQALETLVNLDTDVSAVFFHNDHMAVGAMLAAPNLQQVIPQDLSVIGFDDVGDGRHVLPGLTTVHQPLNRIGRHAAHIVHGLLETPRLAEVTQFNKPHDYHPNIVERESVADLKTDAALRGEHKKHELTRREVQCLYWTAQGKTSWEIACILGIAESTITYHLRNSIRKLNASNRVHAVAKALNESLISFDSA